MRPGTGKFLTMLIDGTFLVPLQSWLETHFPSSRLLVVGGSVRDAVRGHPSKDLDLEIVGARAEEIVDRLPWPVQQVGKSFAVLLVQLPELGWVEVSVESGPFQQWEQLCRRRDFTCNAIAWDVAAQNLIDPLGGVEHIQRQLLVAAGPDSLLADPLRVWRAAQFCARFGWSIDEPLRHQIAAALPLLPALPRERVTREWEKLLTLPEQPGRALELLHEWGVIDLCYPELAALHGCPQDPTFHPEGDVWTHTLMVVDEAARLGRERACSPGERLQLGLAALLHDLGKPETTREEGGRITAHGHERVGLKPARQWLDRHSFGENLELGALDCVAKHMRPMQLIREIEQGKLSPSQQVNALRRLIRDLPHVDWPLFLLLCEADQRGRGVAVGEYLPARILGEIASQHPVLEMARATLLRGRDLLELGIEPGKSMGEWIARVEQARDDGEVATTEGALDWLRQRLAEAR